MRLTTELGASGNGRQPRPPKRPALPKRGRVEAKRQRSPLLGGIALLLGILAFVVILSAVRAAAARQPYLALADAVAAGEVIREEDLVRVDAAFDGDVNAVAAADRARVVGKIAVRSLRAGDLLAPSDWVDGIGPGGGRVVVPITLAGDRLPGRIEVGDRVRLVRTPEALSDDEGAPIVLTDDGVVFEVTQGSRLSERSIISINVPEADAASLAAAAADGRIALILVARGA